MASSSQLPPRSQRASEDNVPPDVPPTISSTETTEGLPRVDPAQAAVSEATQLEGGAMRGAAAGALVGAVVGATGGAAAALSGALAAAAAGAGAGAIIAHERGPQGDAVDMAKFGDAVVRGEQTQEQQQGPAAGGTTGGARGSEQQ